MPPWKRTVYAACIAQALSIVGFSCVMPFLPFYIQELGITDEADAAKWAGWVTTASALTFALVSPIWGALADRYGRKAMVIRSTFSGGVVLYLMSRVRTVWGLAACRVLQGAFTGTITANTALVAGVAPLERAGFAIGLVQSAVYFGSSVGPLLGGVVADLVGRRAAFRVGALSLLVAGILVKFAVHETRTAKQEASRASRGSYRDVFAAAGFVAAAFALFSIQFAGSLPGPILPLFVARLHANTKNINTITGALSAVGGLAAAVAAVILGRFSDTFGHRRLVIVGTVWAAVMSVLHAMATSVGQLFPLRFCMGLGEACVVPAANAIIRKTIDDKNLGKAYGATTMFTSLGWALGPLAGGYLASGLGLRAPFAIMGLAQLVTTLVVRACIRPDGPMPTGTRGEG